ncbi:MAG: response regulator [Deltaproteobacteria bacterium]|nr:response regulator [Deltaproteobacteria bacterium]
MSKVIMVVDDSDIIREMATFVLEKSGFKVVAAVDGQEAFEKLEKTRVDLLISDLHMPNMDGIALTKAIRSESLHRFMPVVLLTSESQKDKINEARAAGATGCLEKPFEPDQLLATVKRLIRS